MQWQPIETAPKDRRILLFFPTRDAGRGVIEIGEWDADGFSKKPRPYWSGDQERIFGRNTYRENPPTHWAELPAHPAA